MIIKDRGIIIKYINTGEADKIATILTQHHGKLKAVIKGCRKPKSKFVGLSEQFAVSEMVLYKGNGDLYSISQGEVKESFFNLRKDILQLSYGNYFAELAEIVADEDVSSEKLFSDLVWALHYLSNKEVETGILLLAFLLKLMELSGYKPMLMHCSNCHGEIGESEFFSVPMGGMLCERCGWAEKNKKRLAAPSRLNMLQLLSTNMSALVEIHVEPKEFREMDGILKEFVTLHLGKTPKSAAFLESIKGNIDNTFFN